MCGRYTQTSKLEDLLDRFRLRQPDFELGPRYNIAPNQEAPVVGTRPGAPGVRSLRLMQWGLVPYWAKGPATGNRMINARAETLTARPAFRDLLPKRRCLVIADGFYEWFKEGRSKSPMRFVLGSGEPFAFAGLWDGWRRPDTGMLYTFTIVTTPANDLIAKIHDRMPAILSPRDEDRWLDPRTTDPGELSSLLKPYPAALMKGYWVSRAVNSPWNDSAECIRPDNE